MAVITSVRSGPWSDPATWDAGRVPGLGDDVVITSGHMVTLDAPVGDVGADDGDAILIQGELRWNGGVDVDMTLWGNLHQAAGGVLRLDGTASPDHALTIRLNASSSPADGKYGLILDDHANAVISGYPRPSYVWARHTGVSSGVLTVVGRDLNPDPSLVADWRVGDRVYVPGIGFTSIAAISGAQVTLASTGDANPGIIAHFERNVKLLMYTDKSFTIRADTPTLTLRWVQIESANPPNDAISLIGDHDMDFEGTAISAYMRLNRYYRSKVMRWDRAVFVLHSYSRVHHGIEGPITGSAVIGGHCWTPEVHGHQTISDSVFKDGPFNFRQLGTDPFEFRRTLFIGISDFAESDRAVPYSFYDCDFEGCRLEWVHPETRIEGAQFGFLTGRRTTLRMVDRRELLADRASPDAVDVTALNDVAELRFYTPSNEHTTYTAWFRADSVSPLTYQGGATVKVTGRRSGEFRLETNALVSAGAFYRWRVAVRKNATQTSPPRFRASIFGTLIGEVQAPDSVDTWEVLELTWQATVSGFVRIEFIFTADRGDGSEEFYLGDAVNSFLYWSRGYIIPVWPRPTVAPDALAEAVWRYASRGLTEPVDVGSVSGTPVSGPGDLKADLSPLLDIELGRWAIEDVGGNAVLVLYRPDNVTEIARFSLHAPDGSPLLFSSLSGDAAAERRRL